eukprot:130372-Rhodomonas_salina.2
MEHTNHQPPALWAATAAAPSRHPECVKDLAVTLQGQGQHLVSEGLDAACQEIGALLQDPEDLVCQCLSGVHCQEEGWALTRYTSCTCSGDLCSACFSSRATTLLVSPQHCAKPPGWSAAMGARDRNNWWGLKWSTTRNASDWHHWLA